MFTPGNLLLTTVIVLLLVGTKKIRNAGEDIGIAIKNFRAALNGEQKKPEANESQNTPESDHK
jgi:sec-independent protein translocase protein TatA